jgi:prolipoprotein diacylglyceryltransferase
MGIYNLFSAVGYALAISLFFIEAKRKNFQAGKSLDIIFGALLGGLIGSRLGSALFVYWAYYAKDFSQILIPQLGGKTLVGGLIGGYIGVEIAKKISGFKHSTGDLFAPGLAIGRIGCFFNGRCCGIATNLPWAVVIKGIPRHPAQIYESIFCSVLFMRYGSAA